VHSSNHIEYEIFFSRTLLILVFSRSVKEINVKTIRRFFENLKALREIPHIINNEKRTFKRPVNFQYFSLVILMFLAEFMLGTLAFVFREHLARSLKEELLYGIEKHYNITREPGTLSAMWDHIHTEVCLIKIFAKHVTPAVINFCDLLIYFKEISFKETFSQFPLKDQLR